MLDTTLSPNDIESIRQDAADRGDCDISRLCNLALWGTSDRQRAAAKRKVAKLAQAGAL
ncbi:MAG: hypothetical protein AB7E70_19630 [Hyphomicrobiaceae bacterium]